MGGEESRRGDLGFVLLEESSSCQEGAFLRFGALVWMDCSPTCLCPSQPLSFSDVLQRWSLRGVSQVSEGHRSSGTASPDVDPPPVGGATAVEDEGSAVCRLQELDNLMTGGAAVGAEEAEHSIMGIQR